jgi:DNA replication protein DnaC
MLDNNTVQKLHEMKLSVMAAAFQKQTTDQAFADMSFEERFGLVVDSEWASRKSNRLTRLIRKADFAWPGACLEDVEYNADRQLDKALIARLGTCGYIDECHNIILLGASGCGKTWLACAFGNAACRNYYTVRYVRLPDLLTELAIARAEVTR